MESLSENQVVLAAFPFSDLSSTKLRPCLVIGIAEFNDIILCQITSQRYGSRKAVPLLHKDFSDGSIVVDSYIRPDKIATLDKRMVKQILGTINPTKAKQVHDRLKAVLKIS